MPRKRGWNCSSSEIERSFGVPRWFARRDWRIARRSQLLGGVEVHHCACMLVPCNLLAQRVRPWSVLGSSGVRTGVFGSPSPVSSSCEYTKRRRSFVMVSIEAHSMGSPIRLRFCLISPYARVRCENKQRGHRGFRHQGLTTSSRRRSCAFQTPSGTHAGVVPATRRP